MCKKIRSFYNDYRSLDFILEFANGEEQKVVYDKYNNTLSYDDDGSEVYEKLFFLRVNDFSLDTYAKLDKYIADEQRIELTNNVMPSKVFGIDRKKQKHELYILE